MILKTEAELEKYNLVNRVFHLDKDSYLYGNLEANVAQPYTAIERDYESSFMKWDIDRIHGVIVRMVNEGKFIFNQHYIDVFQTVFGDEQFQQKAGVVSNDSMVLEELVKRGLWPPTTEVVSQIIIDLWQSLADNSTFTDNKTETNKRNAQIAEMTGNGEHGFTIQRATQGFGARIAFDKNGQKHDPNRGMAQGFQADGGSTALKGPWSRDAGSKSFAEMTNEEVDALYREFKITSGFREMTKEQLRDYVRKAGPTDAFNKNRTTTIVAVPSDRQLINPMTQAQFTQRELRRYTTDFPQAARKMISDPNTGQTIPWKVDLFEKIWRGELG